MIEEQDASAGFTTGRGGFQAGSQRDHQPVCPNASPEIMQRH